MSECILLGGATRKKLKATCPVTGMIIMRVCNRVTQCNICVERSFGTCRDEFYLPCPPGTHRQSRQGRMVIRR